MVKMLSKLLRTKAAEPAPPPPPTTTEILLTEIRDLMKHPAA
jgi:large conductance mechanosensitive channel